MKEETIKRVKTIKTFDAVKGLVSVAAIAGQTIPAAQILAGPGGTKTQFEVDC